MPSATKPSRTGLRSESFAGQTFRVEVSAEFGLYITGGRCNLSIGELMWFQFQISNWRKNLISQIPVSLRDLACPPPNM